LSKMKIIKTRCKILLKLKKNIKKNKFNFKLIIGIF
jgi:hypothetical protein